MKSKMCFVSTIVTRKVTSAYMKRLGGWNDPLLKCLNGLFDIEIYSLDRFLHSDLEPFKLYHINAIYLLKNLKKLMNCDIVVVQGYPAILELFISIITKRLTKRSVIVRDTHWYWPQTLRSKLLFPIYIQLLRSANGIFVPGLRSYMWWYKLGFKPLIIHYYWLEAELSPCNNCEKYDRLKRPYTLLYLGRLIPKRGIDIIVKAFHNFIKETSADSILIIAGGGPLRPSLEKIVEELHLNDKVIFLGPIPEHEKQCVYKIADVFLYTPVRTEIPEEWAIPPLEALKVGCPAIVSDVVGSIPDIEKGLVVVNSGDVIALTKAIMLLYKNYDLRRNLAQQGQERALSITTEYVCREFLRSILSIIREGQNYSI